MAKRKKKSKRRRSSTLTGKERLLDEFLRKFDKATNEFTNLHGAKRAGEILNAIRDNKEGGLSLIESDTVTTLNDKIAEAEAQGIEQGLSDREMRARKIFKTLGEELDWASQDMLAEINASFGGNSKKILDRYLDGHPPKNKTEQAIVDMAIDWFEQLKREALERGLTPEDAEKNRIANLLVPSLTQEFLTFVEEIEMLYEDGDDPDDIAAALEIPEGKATTHIISSAIKFLTEGSKSLVGHVKDTLDHGSTAELRELIEGLQRSPVGYESVFGNWMQQCLSRQKKKIKVGEVEAKAPIEFGMQEGIHMTGNVREPDDPYLKSVWKDSPAIAAQMDPSLIELDGHPGTKVEFNYGDTKDIEKWTLETYMHVCHYLLDSTRKKRKTRSFGTAEEKERRRYASHMWALLKNARIYSFGPELFRDIYHASDVFTTEKIAGMSYSSFGELSTQEKLAEAESQDHKRLIEKEGEDWPFPRELPFDNIWIGLGKGIRLTNLQAALRLLGFNKQQMEGFRGATLLGYLLTRDGDCHEFLDVQHWDDIEQDMYSVVYWGPKRIGPVTAMAFPQFRECLRKWPDSYDLTPWLINGLIGSIESHSTIVIEGARGRFARQTAVRQLQKFYDLKHIPPPYYVITLKKKTIREDVHRLHQGVRKRQLAYQHEREGHYRLRICARGPLPMPEKEREKYQKRAKGVKGLLEIWEAKVPSGLAAEYMRKRHRRPKGDDEWLVTLVTRIDDMMVPADPPPGMPFVPAMRRVPSSDRKSVKRKDSKPKGDDDDE
jgi:hypothetical protein